MSDAFKEHAACRPDNWPKLNSLYGYTHNGFNWVPKGPGGSEGLDRGIRVCVEQCSVTEDCAVFGVLEEEGVWAGQHHGQRT